MFTPEFNKPITFKSILQLTYNFTQACGWFYVAYLLMTTVSSTDDLLSAENYAAKVFPTSGKIVVYLCQLAMLEVVLALLRIIPSSVLTVVMQLIARNTVILVTVNRHVEIQTHVAVFLFFLAWTLTEIIRFPWLMFKTVGKPPYIVSYIRYACPLVLYPLGAVGEFWSMYNAQIVGENDILFSSFTLKHLIHYVYFPLFVPGFLFLYSNAVRQFLKQSKLLAKDLKEKTN